MSARNARAEFVAAWRAWRKHCEAAGVCIYSAAAEGSTTGRGKAKQPDATKALFDAMEAAAAHAGG